MDGILSEAQKQFLPPRRSPRPLMANSHIIEWERPVKGNAITLLNSSIDTLLYQIID